MGCLPLPWSELKGKIFPIRHQEIHVGADFYRFMVGKVSRCNGEVVLAIRRPDGRLLLHTKPFYPPRTWRLPSGGTRPQEGLEEAACRELGEETGLPACLERLLGVKREWRGVICLCPFSLPHRRRPAGRPGRGRVHRRLSLGESQGPIPRSGTSLPSAPTLARLGTFPRPGA